MVAFGSISAEYWRKVIGRYFDLATMLHGYSRIENLAFSLTSVEGSF
jgi:hypothetical protein